MNITQLLKGDYNTRVSSGNRWLIWDNGEWLVLERPYGKHLNITLYRGIYTAKAVEALVKED